MREGAEAAAPQAMKAMTEEIEKQLEQIWQEASHR